VAVASVPFRQTFDCLWCGQKWTTRSIDDLEGWASLCSDCLGRAQDNQFLRFRLKTALRERSQTAAGASVTAGREPASVSSVSGVPAETAADRADESEQMKAYYAARANEYDDWYLRRGRYTRGPVLDMPWHHELDEAGRWLDGLPLRGEIVELAAGTGWWSPILAEKGELSIYDAVEEPLDLARQRLVAHNLRAHIHVRDAWEEPDRQVDAVFAGFWLSHVRRDRLGAFLGLAGRWLKPGGLFAFIDSQRDPDSGALDHPPVGADEIAVRRTADGREFRIPKLHYTADELELALQAAGFADASVSRTSRFFLMGSARR
jgi:SAM-dependent methyltransferase